MENTNELNAHTSDGLEWKLALEQQEKYNSRYDLNFYFGEKCFRIQHFGSRQDAMNVWDLLKLIAKKSIK